MSGMPLSAVSEKIEYWKSQLIDLSKRNRLLNFRQTKTSGIQLVQPAVEEIFEWLVKKEKPMTFVWSEKSPQAIDLLNPGKENKENGNVLELKPGELLTSLNDSELGRVLYNLRLKSRTAIQEQGVNILFVVFGFLEWTESQSSAGKLRSPLILAPVELIRETVTKPYKITLIDEDVILNPTLVQEMREAFGITIYPLPDDPDSLSLHEVFDQIRRATADQPSWSIIPEAYLGLFSFTKLVMYKDLETYADCASSHPIILALAGDPSRLPPIPADMPTAETLDERVSPEETFQVLDADSSQQEAIIAAKRGVSFVLQGPPGTGKSQSITNIIAECLAAGKTVLFVSEKMAALEVVKKRLDECDLGQFCLELHSYKANKRAVVEELGRTLDAPSRIGPNLSDSELKHLRDLREKLNCYVRALHRPQYPLSFTAFRVHGELARLQDAPDLMFDFPHLMQVSREQFDSIDPLLKRLSVMPQVLENYRTHPWYGCQIKSWSFGIQAELKSHLENLSILLTKLAEISRVLAGICGLEEPQTLQEANWLCRLLQAAGETPFPLKSWFEPSTLSNRIAQAEEAQAVYQEYSKQRDSLLSRYHAEIMAIDVDELLARFEASYRSIFRIFKWRFWRDLAGIRNFSTSQQRIGYAQALEDLRLIKSIHEKYQWMINHQQEHREAFGKYFNGVETQWSSALSSLKWVQGLIGEFDLGGQSILIEIICERPDEVLTIHRQLPAITAYLKQIEEEFHFLGNIFVLRIDGSLKNWLQQRLDHLDKLHEWIDFQNTLEECERNGLRSFTSAALEKKLKADQLIPTFYKRFFQLWLDAVYAQDEALKSFNSSHHQALIEEFRKLDKQQLQIAKMRIQQKLADRRPYTYWADAPSSEQTILRREMAKKRWHKPIRRLFSEIPNLLFALKPCLLMSPLSVSQFLDPNVFKFDVVVFDEASQICPEDAVGAIMRGKQLIVVGDSRQLPPTRFFASMGVDDFESDDEEAAAMDVFESILDECTTIGLPAKMLLWHYRSRHESLIAFSNYYFYDNRLNTFPSAQLTGTEFGIEFVYVPDGIYDRGKSRRNVIEGRKVAELVFRHFENFPERSLGVVAFSEAQQMAILEEIERLRLQKPEYEPLFDESRHEPFFVKNLENVQGDERDVMLFSVGYGKDGLGKMSMNFGPLNSEGGQRRLNVAITRARYHVKLIASIQPTDIDLSRTESRGVKLLRSYTEFAQRKGDRIALLSQVDTNPDVDFGSPFEEEVWKALVEHGLTVHKQVGCAGYRIDLAIVDPKNPGRYLLGIECDGATYHSAKTARDRDRLRQQVLENLGWRIHRVWSRDWIEHPRKEVKRILNVLEAVLREGSTISADGTGSSSHERVNAPKKEAHPDSQAQHQQYQSEKQLLNTLPHSIETYRKVEYSDVRDLIRSSSLDAYSGKFREVVVHVVEQEGPIHIKTVSHRIAEFYGRGRAGSQIRSTVLAAARWNDKIKVKDDFLWPAKMKKPRVRVPSEGEEPRHIEEVALEEIAEAARLCLEDAFSLTLDDLIIQTGRLLGYDRTGQKVRERIRCGIQQLLHQGYVELDGKIKRG